MSVLRHSLQAPDTGASGGSGGSTAGTGTQAVAAPAGGAGDTAATAAAAAATAAASAAAGGGGAGADGKGGQQPPAGAQPDAAATAAAAASAAAAGKTVADPGATDGAGKAWDANWRESYAGDDAAKLNVLKRYADPRAALDALLAGRQKIEELSTKAKGAAPAADATPEQLAQFRKDNGIPEKADDYLANLPTTLKLDEVDKAAITPYLPAMQKANLTPAQAQILMDTLHQQRQSAMENIATGDNTLKAQVEDQLRGEWGNDYRPNINAIQNLFAGFPESAREAILNARTPDGKAIFNDKSIMQAFAQVARAMNPFGTMTTADGGALDGKGVDQRMADIVKMMGAAKGTPDYKAYYESPKVQEEYRNLLQAQERHRARTGA